MNDRKSLAASLSHWVHQRFLWLLVCSYAAAAVCPVFGLWIRDVAFGEVALFGERTRVTLPMLMLAFLLWNAGLWVHPSDLRGLRRGARVLLTGLAANLLIPLAAIFGAAQVMRLWHEPDEVQNILLGLALIASMPIAGSSTAWAQNANGSMPLSLGLVLFSTLLSPLTTPVILRAVGWMADGHYAEALHGLAASGTGAFLTLCVVVPSLLGLLIRGVAGAARIDAVKAHLKLANSLNLLLLIYANASVSLPQAVAYPDADFLAVTLGLASALCLLCFGSGWWVARLLKADQAQRMSLMFGLGMNNNGTGLVLASLTLADHPRVMLPILFYNLIQHLVAGGVTALMSGGSASVESEATGRAEETRAHSPCGPGHAPLQGGP
jgi:BASS family bile acid:Na+ symporter